jgi:diphosphomevalonate decarboxylase
MKIQASAPSNIALIKYMGKLGTSGNVSSNASISYTLDHLKTFVEIEPSSGDNWTPLEIKGQEIPKISANGQARFLKHFAFLKQEFGIKGNFLIRSNNNFPSDCGLASSASSFAALTLAAYKLAKEQNPKFDMTLTQLANLSRQGSGSSCRSLFTPWSIWDANGARDINLPVKDLHHHVVVISDQIKKVSSSEAHQRINSSLLAAERTQRAEKRLQDLIAAIKKQDWQNSFELIWADFWDMHALFETSQPAFGYMTSGSLMALKIAKESWEKTGDGPWITMDAGPNVHLLYRNDQLDMAKKTEKELAKVFQVITNYVV